MKPLKTNDLTALGALMARRDRANVTEAYNDRVRTGQAAKTQPKRTGLSAPPNVLLQKRKREENANRITKHCAVIKRIEPRLLMELLQDFGSIEGLSVPKQEELLKRLDKIRKDYRI